MIVCADRFLGTLFVHTFAGCHFISLIIPTNSRVLFCFWAVFQILWQTNSWGFRPFSFLFDPWCLCIRQPVITHWLDSESDQQVSSTRLIWIQLFWIPLGFRVPFCRAGTLPAGSANISITMQVLQMDTWCPNTIIKPKIDPIYLSTILRTKPYREAAAQLFKDWLHSPMETAVAKCADNHRGWTKWS